MMMDGGRRLLDQETIKPKSVWSTLERFATYFKKYWITLLGLMIFLTLGTVANIVLPEYSGQATDCYIIPNTATCYMDTIDPAWLNPDTASSAEAIGARLAGVGRMVLISLGLLVVNAVFVGISFYLMRYAGQNVVRQMQRDLIAQLHRLSLGYYSKHEAGDIMSRVTNDVDTLQQTFGFALMQVLSSVFTLVWTIGLMLTKEWKFALLSLAILPVMLVVTTYFSDQARKAFRRARAEIGSVNANLQENIAGAREVQAFNREEETIAQFEQSNAANRAANVRAALFTSALNPVLEALGYVSLAIVVVVGGLALFGQIPFIDKATISIGLVISFIQYTQRATQPIQQIALLWTNVQSGIAGGERIFGLLDEQPDLVNKASAKDMPAIQGNVVFEQVTAEYVQGEKVLKDVSFEVKQGQMVAFVGPTGAGKTTIINLIPRLYDVTSGAVRIDGVDVRDVTAESLRRQIGIVLQDTYLFSTTVMDNIRYGRLEATDEEVMEAAKLVAADSFIQRLSEGYQTVLGERGSGLSQGQRQLIAIARVALMNPNILILDEATSSVDTRTERMIQTAFEKLLEGRTSFVIAHRLSTIRNADQVYMLKAGEIVEHGTHNELMTRKGAYYDLYMSQFKSQEDIPANISPTEPAIGD
jgi:ATP-binding cassette, subfamily B, multidrug efflux pump